jgi:hypothetical protein
MKTTINFLLILLRLFPYYNNKFQNCSLIHCQRNPVLLIKIWLTFNTLQGETEQIRISSTYLSNNIFSKRQPL